MAGRQIGTSARVDVQMSPVDKLDPRDHSLGGREGATAAIIVDWDAIRREHYAEVSGDRQFRTGKRTPYPKIYFNAANGMLHLEADTVLHPEWIFIHLGTSARHLRLEGGVDGGIRHAVGHIRTD